MIATPSPPAMRCAGCGHVAVAGEQLPFRCAAAAPGDDVDHLLGRTAVPAALTLAGGDPNPFVHFRRALYSWDVAHWRGMSDDDYVRLVRALDAEVARVDGGGGFRVTPYASQPELAEAAGLAGGLRIKNETGNVSGSHKARHLMGIAVYLAVAEATGLGGDSAQPLAIASCGNAALAAAVVARAAGRALQVFVPPSANARVVARLETLGAELIVCDRRSADPPGDPCYLRFRGAVHAGALPFACQGNENGLTIEGGMTLGFELAAQHAASGGAPLDRIALQIGGGALASSTIQALRWAHSVGALPHLPAVHAVQTESAHPVVDAWRRVASEIERRLGAADVASSDAERAAWIAAHATPDVVAAALAHAAHHRREYMRPIDHAPHSIASGILDDETYDWHQVVRGMLETGGWPVVVSEECLARARDLGRTHTGIHVSATGAAGLAGLLTLRGADAIAPTDQCAAIFSGVQR